MPGHDIADPSLKALEVGIQGFKAIETRNNLIMFVFEFFDLSSFFTQGAFNLLQIIFKIFHIRHDGQMHLPLAFQGIESLMTELSKFIVFGLKFGVNRFRRRKAASQIILLGDE